ncbi:MAG: glycosyltransferase family 2 protein [Candidatus Omnitrophota bacterium]
MTKSDFKISIVTPSYNQKQFIAEAIESVRDQNYSNIEHLIFDNCSTDGTTDLLRTFPHLKWVSESDRGQSHALNKGFKAATGDIIGWLNADDRYLPGCFSKVSEFFSQNKDIDIVYGDYRLIDGAGKVIRLKRELDFDLFMLKYLHVLCIPSTTTFFRKSIFEQGNFLDESYHYAMDYEFFLRLALKGYRFAHIKGFFAEFRWHEESKSSTATAKQMKEFSTALLSHDVFLKELNPNICLSLRYILMVLARLKRYFLKWIKGYYFS